MEKSDCKQTVATFRKVRNILVSEKSQFHTHALLEERSLNVLLRDIPSSYLKLAVKEELEYQNFIVTHVR